MSKDSSTATVEVLTAEVRVLMVGSRQVTLSVYRQLDRADPGKITPFGRVRDRGTDLNVIEVVGADADGVLARSRTHRTSHYCDGSPSKHMAPGDGCEELGRLTAAAHATMNRGPEWEQVWAHKHTWYTYTPDQRTWEEWTGLPLIVLAGLK